jgi:hypothetical protein
MEIKRFVKMQCQVKQTYWHKNLIITNPTPIRFQAIILIQGTLTNEN